MDVFFFTNNSAIMWQHCIGAEKWSNKEKLATTHYHTYTKV